MELVLKEIFYLLCFISENDISNTFVLCSFELLYQEPDKHSACVCFFRILLRVSLGAVLLMEQERMEGTGQLGALSNSS